jgi:hypothetical protein
MTTERSRHLAAHPARLPTGDPHAHPAHPGRPRGRPSHCSTTSHDDGQVQPDASRLPAPPPPSTTSRSDTADAGTDGHRTSTLDTGRRTPERSDVRIGHWTAVAWTGTRGHWTLAPDTGHRTPAEDVDTVA